MLKGQCVVCGEFVTEGQEAVRSHIKGAEGITHAKHLSVRQIARARESGRLFIHQGPQVRNSLGCREV